MRRDQPQKLQLPLAAGPVAPLANSRSLWREIWHVVRESRLKRAVRDWRPDLILPLDDLSAWLLRSFATSRSTRPELRDLLVKSLGDPGGYPAVTDRLGFMNFVGSQGLRKPRHCQIISRETALKTAQEWGYPVVVKTEHTSGGVGVAIAADAEAVSMQLALLRPGRLQKIRQAIKYGIYRLAGFRNSGHGTAILQSFIPGIPAFRTVAAWKGRVLAGVSFAAEQTHPQTTGASTVVRRIENGDMDQALIRITAALGLSGFVSCDFVLEGEGQRAWLIEINPRSTGSMHLGRLWGNDVCGALAAVLKGTPEPPRQQLMKAQYVALFPKELERDPHSPYVRSDAVYHDIPIREPALIEAYCRQLKSRHPMLDPQRLASFLDVAAGPLKVNTTTAAGKASLNLARIPDGGRSMGAFRSSARR
jgi:glutathione synthase/RimK-type ligase-like ATP-grasp enzyme